MSIEEDILTTYQAAEILGIWHTVVRGHIERGNLPAKRYGRRNIILRRSDVEAFKAARERGLYVR
jgi:excisionase family DNA binding protein